MRLTNTLRWVGVGGSNAAVVVAGKILLAVSASSVSAGNAMLSANSACLRRAE